MKGIGENICQIEIYNEYLRKIISLLTQISTVEKMKFKADRELEMLLSKKADESRKKYEARLLSTKKQCDERLFDMLEQLNLIESLKEELEENIPLLKSDR